MEILCLAHGSTAPGENVGIGTVVYQVPKSGREKGSRREGRKEGDEKKRHINFKIKKYI